MQRAFFLFVLGALGIAIGYFGTNLLLGASTLKSLGQPDSDKQGGADGGSGTNNQNTSPNQTVNSDGLVLPEIEGELRPLTPQQADAIQQQRQNSLLGLGEIIAAQQAKNSRYSKYGNPTKISDSKNGLINKS